MVFYGKEPPFSVLNGGSSFARAAVRLQVLFTEGASFVGGEAYLKLPDRLYLRGAQAGFVQRGHFLEARTQGCGVPL